jgi:predicted RNA-binding protein YlqC (UPF0109 family)
VTEDEGSVPADDEAVVAADEDGDDPDADDDGSILADVLEYIAREIVDDPDAVEVIETPDSRGVVLTLRVAKDDMGRVIGKGGRTARASRTVVKAAAIRAGIRHTHVEIAD